MNRMVPLPAKQALPILIATALLVQMLGRYHAHQYTFGHFYYSWLVLRIVIPLLVMTVLGLPLAETGLGPPKMDRFLKRLSVFSLFGLGAIYLVIHVSPRYLAYYAGGWGALDSDRLADFALFTLSTLTGWEFLHRSFLLLGVVYLLDKNYRLPAAASRQIAILIVWTFEVLYHFIKPQLEAAGMLLGSPFLSYLTLRSGSIWPAFLIHLGVEIAFILSI